MTHPGTTRLTRRILAAGVGTLVTVALITGCGGSKPGGAAKQTGSTKTATAASSSTGSTVEVKNFSFDPKTLTVKKGTKVTWKFDDSVKHNVTANNKAFKSKDLSSGGTYSFTFNKAGTYQYICTIHQYMTATITVK